MATFKTLLSVFLIGVLVSSCSIDGKDSSEPQIDDNNEQGKVTPNEAVVRSFDIRFPDARNVVWSTKSTYHVANFKENNSSKIAWFDQKGIWHLTQSSVTTSQMPKNVKTAFNQSTYATSTVKGTSLIERKGMGNVYLFQTVGTSHINVYYTDLGDHTRIVRDAASYEEAPIEIPQAVSTIVSNLLGNATIYDIWSDALGVKVCTVDDNEYKVVALDANLDWISTIVNLTAEIVPENVMESFMSSQYGAYPIDDIKRMDNANEKSYLFYFEADNKHKIATLKETGGFKSILSY